MVHDPSFKNNILAAPVELTEQDEKEFAALASENASEEQVRKYIKKTTEVRIRHYEKLCRDGHLPDTVREQLHTKEMQKLVGELWTEIVVSSTNASIAGKVTAAHMMNAVLHACAEASVMTIKSYAKAYILAEGMPCDTKKLVEAFATSMGRLLLEISHANELL